MIQRFFYKFIEPILPLVPTYIFNLVPQKIKEIVSPDALNFIKANKNLIDSTENATDKIILFKNSIWKDPYHVRNFIRKLRNNPRNELMTRTTTKLLLNGFKDGDKLLDLACGPGMVLESMQELRIFPIGLDSSLLLLKNAQRKHIADKISNSLVCGDAFSLPFRNQSFDGVLSRMFIYHFPNWSEILKEVCRILIPKGIFNFHFTSFEHKNYFEELTKVDSSRPVNGEENIFELSNFNSYTPISELKSVAEQTGFEFVQSVPTQFFNQNLILPNLKNVIDDLANNESGLNLISLFENEVTPKLPLNLVPWQIISLKKV